ncbi:NAD-dependent protein deacylase SIR4 [Exophiala dermatitidis]
MSKPLLRIPYTGPLPPPLIIPHSAATKHGAVTALANFLTSGPGSPVSASPSSAIDIHPVGVSSIDTNIVSTHGRDGVYGASQNENLQGGGGKTVLLTGAGISVASGLADYRGSKGTYTQNKSYRPIYFHEFVASHEARKRYWARSFLGWRGLHRASPNAAHYAVRDLGRLGLVDTVITQNVDSFHPIAHPHLPKTIELHGFLRSLVCLSCKRLMDREAFQAQLAELNPAWNAFLQELLLSGALDTEDPEERRRKGFRTNPDGDADVPGAPYTTFRYPACPHCLKRPPILSDGSKGHVDVDADGAWVPKSVTGNSTAGAGVGILKPNVIMFGESIPASVKTAAEAAIDASSKVLVVGSSLATYSAWRLVKRAHERGMGIGVLNLGGVRKEEVFFGGGDGENGTGSGHDGWAALRRDLVRASLPAEEILPKVVEYIRSRREGRR